MRDSIIVRKLKTALYILRSFGWKALSQRAASKFWLTYYSRLRPLRVSRLPETISIEVTSLCNLRCTMCGQSLGPERPSRHLSVSEFDRICTQFPRLSSVCFTGISEALLNREIYEMMARCCDRGIFFGLTTNGTALTPSNIERLIKFDNLMYIGVSIDGCTRETFEAIRVGASFDAVVRNTTQLAHALQVVGRRDLLTIQFTLQRRNLHELWGMLDICKAIGARTLEFASLFYVNDQLSVEDFSEGERQELIKELRAIKARGAKMGIRFSGGLGHHPSLNTEEKLGCRWPWHSTFIAADGTVYPCCEQIMYRKNPVILGNIFERSFSAIWNGKEYQEFRAAMKAGVPEICQVCPFYMDREDLAV